jgi:hypothetical protein
MFFQTGYARLSEKVGDIEGFMPGLGGRLHFYIGNYVRLGGAGASTKLTYEDPGAGKSSFRLSYGGATVEGSIPVWRFRFSEGVFAGQGNIDHLHILQKNDILVLSELRQYSTFVISPLSTIEFSIVRSIAVMVAADFPFGTFAQRTSLGGPRFHVGVIFNKPRPGDSRRIHRMKHERGAGP